MFLNIKFIFSPAYETRMYNILLCYLIYLIYFIDRGQPNWQKQLKESCTKIQICLRLKILRTGTYSVACPYFPMKKFFSSSSTFHSCSIIDIAIRNINISF